MMFCQRVTELASVSAAVGYPFLSLESQRALVARLHSKRKNSVFVELAQQLWHGGIGGAVDASGRH